MLGRVKVSTVKHFVKQKNCFSTKSLLWGNWDSRAILSCSKKLSANYSSNVQGRLGHQSRSAPGYEVHFRMEVLD